MADYAQTTTLDTPRVVQIDKSLRMVTGKCDITNYNTTGAEITEITRNFRTVQRVMCEGLSDNGYLVRWDTTDKCFHAFYPVYAIASTGVADANNTLMKSASSTLEVAGTGTAFGQPGVEVANDVDVGEVNFIAFGLT
jgi:hypothetical protein